MDGGISCQQERPKLLSWPEFVLGWPARFMDRAVGQLNRRLKLGKVVGF